MSQIAFTVLVALVALERLAELVVAQRNLKWSLARGGRESGFGHYPFMVALHTGLLAACLIEVWVADPRFIAALGWPMLVLVVAAQGLRWWCIRSLGHAWNTRIVVIPGFTPVASGPYRLMRHPNYVAVVIEGFALPLVHTAVYTAVGFTVLNAVLLAVRINAENHAMDAAHAHA